MILIFHRCCDYHNFLQPLILPGNLKYSRLDYDKPVKYSTFWTFLLPYVHRRAKLIYLTDLVKIKKGRMFSPLFCYLKTNITWSSQLLIVRFLILFLSQIKQLNIVPFGGYMRKALSSSFSFQILLKS